MVHTKNIYKTTMYIKVSSAFKPPTSFTTWLLRLFFDYLKICFFPSKANKPSRNHGFISLLYNLGNLGNAESFFLCLRKRRESFTTDIAMENILLFPRTILGDLGNAQFSLLRGKHKIGLLQQI